MSETQTWDIVVVGSANTDYTVRGEQLLIILLQYHQISFQAKVLNK